MGGTGRSRAVEAHPKIPRNRADNARMKMNFTGITAKYSGGRFLVVLRGGFEVWGFEGGWFK